MADEITNLLNTAIDREIAAEAFYLAAEQKTTDIGARTLLSELAKREAQHREWLKNLQGEKGKTSAQRIKDPPDLGLSEGLVELELTEGASLQDVLTIAMKREEHSVEFYLRLRPMLSEKPVQSLCEKIIREERSHKHRLEVFYDDFFNREN